MSISKKNLKKTKDELIELRRGQQATVVRTTQRIEAIRSKIKSK
jgi:hypothetical protein